MKFIDILHETELALSANKTRSALTILGIVIGISSVIAMVSIGSGASSNITSRISSLGSNLISISPGSQRNAGGFGAFQARGSAKTLTQEDADAIASQVQGVQAVAGVVSSRYQVTAPGTNTNTQVYGVSPSYAGIRSVDVSDGSFITDTQNAMSLKVAVLGPTTRDDLFGENADGVIGQSIRISGQEFKVIGITVSKGTSGFSNQDDMIYIPVKTAQRLLSGDQYLATISVQAQSAEVMTQVQNDITDLLLARHKKTADTADFSVTNQNDLLSTASSITSTLTYLLAAIGSISLLVGGIGIMNMMLTTVTERTREIGLRKAIGAKGADIRAQFLSEAIALTVIGGIIGIVLGCAIAWGVNATGLVTTTVSLNAVLLAFGVAAATGIVFGYYPARKASRMNPIEALRYE